MKCKLSVSDDSVRWNKFVTLKLFGDRWSINFWYHWNRYIWFGDLNSKKGNIFLLLIWSYSKATFSVAKATLQSQMSVRSSVRLSSKPPSTLILHLSTFFLHLSTFILHLSTFIIHLSTFILHFATFKLFSLLEASLYF